MSILRLLAVCGVLTAVGCSDIEIRDHLNARGCHVSCDWCINLDSVCAADLDTSGVDVRDEVAEPSFMKPDVNINLPGKK